MHEGELGIATQRRQEFKQRLQQVQCEIHWAKEGSDAELQIWAAEATAQD